MMALFQFNNYDNDDTYRYVAWLNERVGYRGLEVSIKSGKYHLNYYRRQKNRKNRRHVALCDTFATETGLLGYRIKHMAKYHGNGWRIYNIYRIITKESEVSTTYYGQTDQIIKIYNDDLALQFKLALL
jgi:hypothetical protein